MHHSTWPCLSYRARIPQEPSGATHTPHDNAHPIGSGTSRGLAHQRASAALPLGISPCPPGAVLPRDTLGGGRGGLRPPRAPPTAGRGDATCARAAATCGAVRAWARADALPGDTRRRRSGCSRPRPPFSLPPLPPPTTTPPSRCPALQPERLIHNSARPGSGSTARCGGKEAAPPGARRRGWGWGGGGHARRRPAQLLGAAPLPRRPVPACAPPAPPSRAPSVTPPRRGLTQFGAEVTGSRAPLPAQPPPHSQGPAAGSTPPPHPLQRPAPSPLPLCPAAATPRGTHPRRSVAPRTLCAALCAPRAARTPHRAPR